EVSAGDISPIARDLRYAYLLFCMLAENKRTDLFPKELATAEYLAKSDMVQWLAYPTELGKSPDEIELIGCAEVKKELFYIFKFKSDSDTLSDDLKNIWLIGWSSSEGGTFSDFDRLCDYECKTAEKTVKNIVKKLLK
ncbi:MAG: hypothetical protein K2N30_04990, partial [Clostridia bacterium]|nr:hypothetical protein [Clostridia bacterium]